MGHLLLINRVITSHPYKKLHWPSLHLKTMRLLNTETLTLCDFPGSDAPPYVILSHTWGNDEVSFQDIQGPRDLVEGKRGFKKIAGCCQKASQDGYSYVWIDTCWYA